MQIIIKTLDLYKYKIEIDENDTIMMILVKLQEFIEEINPKNYYFVCKGQILIYHKTLKDYNISNKSFIYIVSSFATNYNEFQDYIYYNSDNDI